MKNENKEKYREEIDTESFIEKFPWVCPHVDPTHIKKVQQEEVSLEIFGIDNGYQTDGSKEFLTKNIFLFTKDGRLLGQVGCIHWRHEERKWPFFWKKATTYINKLFPENIGSAVKRVQKDTGDRVYYVVTQLWNKKTSRYENVIFTSSYPQSSLTTAVENIRVKEDRARMANIFRKIKKEIKNPSSEE